MKKLTNIKHSHIYPERSLPILKVILDLGVSLETDQSIHRVRFHECEFNRWGR